MLTFFFKRKQGAAGTYHAKTQTFLNTLASFGESAGGIPNEVALDRLVRDINGEANTNYTTYNIWSKKKALYPFIGGTAFAHSLNLIDQSQYPIGWTGSPTHNANGVQFNGTSQYGNTGINPSTMMGLYDKAGGMYVTDIVPGNTWEWGVYDGANCFAVRHLNGGTITGVGVNDLQQSYSGFMNVAKYCSIDISNSVTAKIYGEGIAGVTLTPGGAVPNDLIYVGGITPAYLGEFRSKLFWLGASLTDAEHLFLNNAIAAYQTALGRA